LPSKLIYTIGDFKNLSKRIRELAWIEKDVVASTEARERCTMQFVQIVASRPRFPSSPTGPGQFIAAIATRSTGHPEEASKEIYSRSSSLRLEFSWIIKLKTGFGF